VAAARRFGRIEPDQGNIRIVEFLD
jgi:hypothetical protein